MPCAFDKKDHLYTCQFDFAEKELINHEGENWCLFHLPKVAKDDWTTERNNGFYEVLNRHVNEDSDRYDYTGVVFPAWKGSNPLPKNAGHIDCGKAEFLGPAKFPHEYQSASFCNATFHDSFSYQGKKMSDSELDFSRATFMGPAIIKVVAQRVIFIECCFQQGVDLSTSRFHRVWFCSARVKHDFRFSDVVCNDLCDFSKTSFYGSAIFISAVFNNSAIFSDVTFYRGAYFSGNKDDFKPWFKTVDFTNAEFHNNALFNNRKFEGRTMFSSCTFYKAPLFFGSEFKSDTNFHTAKFFDTTSVHSENAYRSLRESMNDIGAQVFENTFFALEQRSRRLSAYSKWSLNRVFSFLYDTFSEYGESIKRPIVGLGWCALFFWLAFSWIFSTQGVYAVSIIGFTISQIFRPFFVWSEGAYFISTVTLSPFSDLALRVLATLQSVISVGLLTLFILALRRRFRLD